MRKWLFFLFLPCLLFATCPKTNGVSLSGIVFIDAKTDTDRLCRKEGITVKARGVDLEGIESALAPYFCRTVNPLLVQDVKNATLDFLNHRGIFAMVVIPEQEVTDGVMVVEILLSRVGTISFEGEKWFSKSIFEKGVSLREGEPLDQDALLNDLAFLNRSPFHKTEIVLSPGEEKGTTNLEFLTKDRFPFRFYIGGDNTGVQVTDRIRLFGGMSWGNAFQIGDMLCYQYTASDDFHRFQSHTVTYTANIASRKDLLSVFGSYGMINPDITDFVSTGKSAQASMRYKVPIRPLYRSFKQQLEAGFDYKYLNSNLFFGGTVSQFPISVSSINITQFMGHYSLSEYWERHQISFKVEGFLSPWKGVLPHQNSAAYRKLRPGAEVRYLYFKTAIAYRYLPWKDLDCSLSIYLRGQAATTTLPASEQFSLGGIDTVRGYEQSQFLADNAICSNVEFYFPSITTSRKLRSKATFLAFWDVSYGINYRPANDEIEDQLLSGIGPGFRYEIPSYFTLKADYGFRLNKIPGGAAMGRFYLSAILSY